MLLSNYLLLPSVLLSHGTDGVWRAAQVDVLILDDQEAGLFAVRDVRRAELQRRAEEGGVRVALVTAEPPMPVGAEDVRRGHLHDVQCVAD